jgi:exodeoxyribonuclease VII small subunit
MARGAAEGRKGAGGGPAGSGSGDAEQTFEGAMTRLEALVREMESGRMDLEASLAAFEEGIGLVRFCSDRLRAAEKKVQTLVAGMGGTFRLEAFEETEDDGASGGPESR